MHRRTAAIWYFCIALEIVFPACTKTYLIGGITISDSENRPIPGAVMYVEAYTYTGDGTFDFFAARCDQNGYVPRTEWKVKWHYDGNKFAWLFIAPGKVPKVINPFMPDVLPGGATLHDVPADDDRYKSLSWEDLWKVAFPFEDKPGLARRIANNEYVYLRKAFLDGYLLDKKYRGNDWTEKEKRKVEMLQRLEQATPSQPNK